MSPKRSERRAKLSRELICSQRALKPVLGAFPRLFFPACEASFCFDPLPILFSRRSSANGENADGSGNSCLCRPRNELLLICNQICRVVVAHRPYQPL